MLLPGGMDHELGANVTVIQRPAQGDQPERTLYLVGTAHISKKSVDEVREVVAKLKPDTVCVELDDLRYEALTDESRWRKLNIFDVIKQKKVLFLMANLALASFQRRLGNQLGVKPGADMLAAIESANEHKAEIVLADRNVQATLKRIWANVGFFKKVQLAYVLMQLVFDDTQISEEEVEDLKQNTQQSDAMGKFVEFMPEVKVPLIDERDSFLMSKIDEAPGKVIVAVVGAAHVPGMVARVGETVDRDELLKIPPPSKIVTALKYVLPVLVLSAFGYGFYKNQGKDLLELLFAWVIPNAIFAALFTLIARGRLLSVLVAAIASPITSLNPTIGAGMVVGLVEAWQRKPTVEDCEALGTEVSTFSGMFKNPVSHILIVVLAASFGSSFGAWVGGGWLLTIIGR